VRGAPESFHDFVRELFAGMGPVQVKRMFGGAGGYAQGLMFLLIADDAIYLKADQALAGELRAEGSGPFVWSPDSGPRKGEHVPLGYWQLPDAALDDPDEAVRWGRKALSVARRKAAEKPPRPAKADGAKTKTASRATRTPPKAGARKAKTGGATARAKTKPRSKKPKPRR
jgi:DNA transformation protein